MAQSFENKVALVTGAGNGIGRASALAFARLNAKVIVADIDARSGQETVNLIRHENAEAMFIQTDVANATDVRSLIEKTIQAYGRLDFAHNNAGIEGTMARVADQTEEDWDKLMDVNLKGIFLCMKYEIPAMLKSGGGAIVNTGSVSSEVGLSKYSPYCASKHAIVGLTKTAALEYVKQGIRVNAICPGLIDTDMVERSIMGDGHGMGVAELLKGIKMMIGRNVLQSKQPSGRMGLGSEVAEAVIWLCSDAASYVNGHSLVIDGGFVVK